VCRWRSNPVLVTGDPVSPGSPRFLKLNAEADDTRPSNSGHAGAARRQATGILCHTSLSDVGGMFFGSLVNVHVVSGQKCLTSPVIGCCLFSDLAFRQTVKHWT